MLCPRTAKRAWWLPERAPLAVALALLLAPGCAAHEYFEDFARAGKPSSPGLQWTYRADLSAVSGWGDIIPGDGFAHISVERGHLPSRARGFSAWPFQALEVGPVTSNHRISIRAKGAAIPGVAGLLFTYREKTKVDEIDIEIATHDTEAGHAPHPTNGESGWTDVRLNTWANASGARLEPSRGQRMPIAGASGAKVSHCDGKFHVYTIDWRPGRVRFYIDNVLQTTIDDVVPDYPSSVIFGLRQTPWAGTPTWEGKQTMLVDWVAIEPVSDY